ncbi:MAG: amidase, partial [Gammaproteobacteria bacterium]|nr:amidase [Gammaproteobacteria bacterium]
MSDLALASIAELARAFEQGSTTPDAAMRAVLDRIEQHESRLGAFQVVYAEEAMQAAEASTRLLRSGHRVGPFHGIPFALKDIVDLAGRVTTGGSAAMRDRVPEHSAAIARNLIAAGGVLIGKTRTVEVAMGGWGTNRRMGTPVNPWDLRTHRAPGGSSSGSGVAVAAGMAHCAVGTDTGGS